MTIEPPGGNPHRNGEPAPDRLTAVLESILFVASGPVALTTLARAVGVPVSGVRRALGALASECQRRGVRLQQLNGTVQLVSDPASAPYVEQFIEVERRAPLSRPALETLAIIAYQQPITRPAIERIRGVNSESVLATLQARELVEPLGRGRGAGRPLLYGTTFRFLQHFGLERPEDLPPLSPTGHPPESGGEAEPPAKATP